MIGNVYVKYASEDDAAKAAGNLSGRYYAGRVIECEFSPVTDFREARCRQFVDGQCTRKQKRKQWKKILSKWVLYPIYMLPGRIVLAC